ncbi:Cell division protein FtsL [Candidatus Electrothrix gigas]
MNHTIHSIHSVHSIRSPTLSTSLRRQVKVLRQGDSFSEDFVQLSAYTLGTIFLVFFFVSIFFSWNISREKGTFMQQQLVHESLRQEQAILKAKRDKLLAKPRLVALAAMQLDLHLPEKGQEYYLY